MHQTGGMMNIAHLIRNKQRNIPMGQIKAKSAAILNARPEDVYTTIADYQHSHPDILPKESRLKLLP
jgi:hypothetical protein